MEATVLVSTVLGLLLLPLLTVLLVALCLHCRELPGSNSTVVRDSNILIKRPREYVGPSAREPPAPWPPVTYLPVTSYPSVSQPDVLPIPRSPQPPEGSHRMPSSRRDSTGANSVGSYENEEPACEDTDEEEDEGDSHNEGYLEVLPDTPGASTSVPPASVPSNPGLRDSAFSMETGEDYVNVPESEGSAEASLDGSREYVNVSPELQPSAQSEPATSSSQEVEEEEEGAPDYENL